jgi:hypothetical protein
MGLNIHVEGFDEDTFKGVFSYKVLLKLSNDVTRKEIQDEQEEMKKFHQNRFLRLLQEDQNQSITKEI